jgi:hypothetical protein
MDRQNYDVKQPALRTLLEAAVQERETALEAFLKPVRRTKNKQKVHRQGVRSSPINDRVMQHNAVCGLCSCSHCTVSEANG